ncbi:hypothetical protein ACHAQH_005171 [Verticillium albo-atrum]
MPSAGGIRLIVSCWTLAGIAGALLFLRLYCKIWRGRGLWWDDHLLILAWVTLAIAVAINTYIVTLGFGDHVWTVRDENLRAINLNTILVATFGIIATTTSKSSFAMTLYRLSTAAWMRYLLIFIMITINISMNMIWVFGLAKCQPLERVFDNKVPGTCWDPKKLLKYQLFAAYYSAALDFVLALLPWQILMGASMLRRERLGVAIAMSLGAIAGVTGIVKAVLAPSMTSPDFTFQRIDLTIWTLAEPAASIMAVSIPMLRMLYKKIRSSREAASQRYVTGGMCGSNSPRTVGSTVDGRKSKRLRQPFKYSRNSVVIISNVGWDESHEALRDPEGSLSMGTPPALVAGGMLKTEEVRVYLERINTGLSDGNSIEMERMGIDRGMERPPFG